MTERMARTLMLCGALLVHSSAMMAATSNYSDDWAPPANPNGAWSYESVFASVANPVANVATFNANRATNQATYDVTKLAYVWPGRMEMGQTWLTPDDAVAALVVWTAPADGACAVTGSLLSTNGEDNVLFKVLAQDVSAGTITELYANTTTAGGAAITWNKTATFEAGHELLF